MSVMTSLSFVVESFLFHLEHIDDACWSMDTETLLVLLKFENEADIVF